MDHDIPQLQRMKQPIETARKTIVQAVAVGRKAVRLNTRRETSVIYAAHPVSHLPADPAGV